MKNEVNKTVLENRAKFIEMCKNAGITEQQLEAWFNDPAKLSIVNALCAK